MGVKVAYSTLLVLIHIGVVLLQVLASAFSYGNNTKERIFPSSMLKVAARRGRPTPSPPPTPSSNIQHSNGAPRRYPIVAVDQPPPPLKPPPESPPPPPPTS
ncbi:hypothetical protein TIFTF001_001032 [Ficus carica]|uniref:Uncharacterized protein n=1 Tax=Ficus carica TaxID=3494 RepID=A0AA88D3G3_FICCA|nr:hypothetical protein TIFTF001_001032 [Ficus carica]